ncbi:MAG: chromate transporter [Clostridiales bacterium]|jgi:chromate transporter|nr:chromate transporter [Bacillota bacterium]NLL55390.1 chromate transporter [Clostridiales bacterium]
MSTLLTLCLEFFRTGLLAVGGGLATLPFLNEMSMSHPTWFDTQMLSNMIAVSESTPGPIGINMATYVGFTVAGVPGALCATLSLVLPSIVVITIVARILQQFKENRIVKSMFSGLRPAVTGLIAAAAYSVIQLSLFHSFSLSGFTQFFGGIAWLNAAIFTCTLFFIRWKKTAKLHPIAFIGICALLGILFKL